jgi:hypothetical protein
MEIRIIGPEKPLLSGLNILDPTNRLKDDILFDLEFIFGTQRYQIDVDLSIFALFLFTNLKTTF